MQEASKLSEDLCVFHEHSDHYSLQVTREMGLEEFNGKLTEYLKSLPSNSKEEFLEWWDDVDDQDN